MNYEITSEKLKKLFKQTERDEHVFGLNDYPGIQVVRKYQHSLKDFVDKRMFIKFILIQDKDVWYVGGGVDTVKNKENEESGWTIQFSENGFFRKPTNYSFWKSENIYFDSQNSKILFEGKSYELNQFIDQLEKNHLRGDMFLISRLKNFLKLSFLYLMFFFSDAKYKKLDYIFKKQEEKSLIIPQKNDAEPASEKADPLFHYFYIYKNLFGFSIFLLLPVLFSLSLHLSESYFTVSNPFLLFSVLFLFYILEKVSNLLFHYLSKPNFVQGLTRSALELKGNLKKF